MSEIGFCRIRQTSNGVKVTYDKQADAMYIYLAKGRAKETIEVNSRVIVDVGENGKVIGIELLFVSEKMPKSILRSQLMRLPAGVR